MGKTKIKTAKPKQAKSSSASKKSSKQFKKGFIKKKQKHKWARKPSKDDEISSRSSDSTGQSQFSRIPVPHSKKMSGSGDRLTNQKNSGLSLREKMMKQLNAARFRQINETLDSGTSDPREAFDGDQSVYAKYHETYNELKQSWEVNPIDDIIKRIESRHEQHNANGSDHSTEVVDFGCGDGHLEDHFENTNVTVHGVDLYKLHPKAIVCDMTKVPFKNNSTDIAVFCLSLMAKDVGKFIMEANRILKMKGTLMIAEVESRFIGGAKKFTLNLKSYGFVTSRKAGDGNGKQDKFNSHVAHTRLNDMFIIMEFRKVKNLSNKLSNLPTLKMKPCVYKKR